MKRKLWESGISVDRTKRPAATKTALHEIIGAGMDIRLEQISDTAQETDRAKAYWASPGTQPLTYNEASHYAAAIAEIAIIFGCRRVFEFGCAAGRNLHVLRTTLQDSFSGELVIAGSDINEASVKFGREQHGINILLGDESRLREFGDNEFDLSFTVSVLDHLPDPKLAMAELVRIAGSVSVFLEPTHETINTSGKIEAISTSWGVDNKGTAMPFTYIHDYPALIREAGAEIICSLPLPTHLNRAGPLYRLYVVSKTNVDARPDENAIREAVTRVCVLQLLTNLRKAQDEKVVAQSETDRLRRRHETEKLRSEALLSKTNSLRRHEIEKLQKQHEDALRKVRQATEKQYTSGLEYRWGTILVRYRRRFWLWPFLPLKLYQVYKAYKRFLASRKDLEGRQRTSVRERLLAALHEPIQPRSLHLVENRICYVLHNSLPYASGGYATRGHGLAKGLASHGFEVIALTRPGFPIDTKEIDPADVTNHSIDGIQYQRIFSPLRKGKPPLQYMTDTVPAFEAAFRDLRPSVVIGASFYLTAMPAMIAARRLGIPFIYELRGLSEITKISRDASYADTPAYAEQVLMEAETGKYADHMFTLTKSMREESILRGIDGEKITLLPNSCDPEQFSAAPKDLALARRYGFPEGVPIIGYVGSIVDYEGLDDLIEACALLKNRGNKFRILIVGSETATGEPGVVCNQIKLIAKEAGLEEWLVMPGRIPHHEVKAHYSLIDIAPFPRKPWPVCEMVSPMKPLEAFAMEKAVVVSSVSALAEMVKDGETGMIFQKGDVSSLAAVLEQLLTDSALRGALGKSARHHVESERTWKNTAAIAADIIRRLTPKEKTNK